MNELNENEYISKCDNRYYKTLDEYKLHNPTSSEHIVMWRPVDYHDIEVILDDGSRWFYDHITSSSFCVSRDLEHKACENEKDFKRRSGYVLSKKIRNAGFSQAAFSELCGISRTTLRNYLSGRNLPNSFALKRMANVLGCSPMELMDFE